MCGITGFFKTGKSGNAVLCQDTLEMSDSNFMAAVVKQMTDALQHRGPDDSGLWVDAKNGIALGHRRLSIVDLSPAGHQPMMSASGRYVLSFNGEIYNHLKLRKELEGADCQFSLATNGPLWRGHSDTETLLAGFEAWGVETTLRKAIGMFAIALWDNQEKTLILARDRLGEKPLYYGWINGMFVFGSELKALKAYPGFDSQVCRQALAQYLRFMYVPAPRSIFQGIYKLEPGCVLSVKSHAPSCPPSQPLQPAQDSDQGIAGLQLSRWWSLADVVIAGTRNTINNEDVAISQLEESLKVAVQMQSLADVPLGAFLSGGIDSSTIVALMQQGSSRPVKTFTIGFDEAGFDESPYARAIADHLGTDHTEMRVTAQMALDVIPNLPWMYDEPFADSSQIPTHLVSRAAKQHVKVALSGDAGDELFGGYNRYFWGPRIWNRLSLLPSPARKILGTALVSVPIGTWNKLGGHVFGPSNALPLFGDKVHKLADRVCSVNNMEDLYRSLVSEWSEPANLVISGNGSAIIEPRSTLDAPLPFTDMPQPLPMMYRDSMSYLTDDILCKVDRAAMACSLETRVPFLDHRVVELAWRLPLHMKIRGNTGKWALRQVLYKYVPKDLIERPKAGFAIPLGEWLRGPLRDWSESLLCEKRLKSEGFLLSTPIRTAWAEHLNGSRDHTTKIWAVLMFQAWLEKNR